MPSPFPNENDKMEESSESYQVTRYIRVPEKTDATTSTAEELEQVAFFEEF